ncbi:MAG: outer membrane beta-barrel protein [Gammaproteobacteria bacterium]
MGRYGRGFVILVLLGMAFGKDLTAAEWSLTGALNQQLEYNDNISLNPIRKDSVFGYRLIPGLLAKRTTEALDLALEAGAEIRRYDDTRWNCDNYSVGFGNLYITAQKKHTLGLKGGYAVACSYSQQLTDTGLLLPNSQSETYLLAPSWTWQWSARDQLLLNASYNKTTFGQTASGLAGDVVPFTNSTTYTADLGATHKWSRRLSLNGKLSYSNVQFTGANPSTQNLFGFEAGASYLLTRNWTVRAAAGPKWVQGSSNTANQSPGQNSGLTLGYVANVEVSYQGQFTNWTAGFTSSITPSAIGQNLQTQTVFANYSYQLSEFVLFLISANYSQSKSIGGQTIDATGNQFDRIFLGLSTGLTWEFMENWQLKGNYSYSRQDFKQGGNIQNLLTGVSDANLVMLNLSYSWDGIRTSR